MRKAVPASASGAPRLATDGSRIRITLKDDDGKKQVLSGVITNQPTKQQMGILLDGRFYFGRANYYSRDTYRLLIEDRIWIRHASKVRLIALSTWLMALHF